MKIFGKVIASKIVMGAALVAATLGLGATQAHAARIGVYVGAPVPVCPGPGYVWVDGYYNAYGAWVPGYWNFVGVGYHVGPVVRWGGPVYHDHFYGRGYYGHGYFHGRR